ncbi:VOC family protein [Streptomyces sp. P38-E01]|uniref:VOC family protein n=1 Tax=Streptomyces tardus TaxID=2780544 RepID=A0A949JII6_9ACTN|nr:VOC family protein [Streptomyces tardus]MBU7600791.1 VOC family protein [Streptomyces tardus]
MGVAEFKDLALDATDHQALADWWCRVLGYTRRQAPAGGEESRPEYPVPIHDPRGRGPVIWINPASEAKSAQNRMHLDVWGRTEDLLELGATMVRRGDAEHCWDVMADPEGNEFHVFAPDRPSRPVIRLRPR